MVSSSTAARVEKVQERGLGRNFRLYAAGQTVSLIGDRVALIALVFLVIHLSGSSALALGVFYLCRVLPTLLGGLPAGVIADRFDRRRLMICCDLLRTLVLLVVPTLSSLSLWTLYPLVIILYALTLLFDTTVYAALPDVVQPGQMVKANAILRSIETAADFAYAAGGALVFLFKLRAPFYIDAGTFGFSAVMVAAMRVPSQVRGRVPGARDMVARVRAGVAYLMGQPFLRFSTFTFAIAPFAGGVIFVLVPLYASRSLAHSPGLIGPLHSGAFRFSSLEVSLGIGALLGSLLAGWLSGRWPRGKIFGLGIAGLGVSTGLFAFTQSIYVAAVLMISAGVCNSLFVVAGMTLLQVLTPTDLRGRVVAARLTVINTALALGTAVGGAVLLRLPYATAWLLLGAIITASSLFVWLRPEVRAQV